MYAVRAGPLWKDPEATSLLRRAIAKAAPLLGDQSNEDVKAGEKLFAEGPFPAGHAPAGVIRAAFISGECGEFRRRAASCSGQHRLLSGVLSGSIRCTVSAAVPPARRSIRHFLLVRPAPANRPTCDVLRRLVLCPAPPQRDRWAAASDSTPPGRWGNSTRGRGSRRRRRDARRADAVTRDGRGRSAGRVERGCAG